MIYRNKELGLASLIVLLLFFAAFMVGLFYLMKGLYYIMLFVAPILAISILFIDYRSYTAFGNWLKRKYKRDVLSGVTWTLACIAGFPFVLFILLYRALFLKGIESTHGRKPPQTKRPHNEYLEYHDYEIIEEDQE